jgi:hypothetical protein
MSTLAVSHRAEKYKLTFRDTEGNEETVSVLEGDSILDAAILNDIEIEGVSGAESRAGVPQWECRYSSAG